MLESQLIPICQLFLLNTLRIIITIDTRSPLVPIFQLFSLDAPRIFIAINTRVLHDVLRSTEACIVESKDLWFDFE
jgi:hypothetical protein